MLLIVRCGMDAIRSLKREFEHRHASITQLHMLMQHNIRLYQDLLHPDNS